jgi:hypothetical protein
MVSRDPVVRVGFALGSWPVVALAAGLAEADARAVWERACEDRLALYETMPVSAELKATMDEVGVAGATRAKHRRRLQSARLGAPQDRPARVRRAARPPARASAWPASTSYGCAG